MCGNPECRICPAFAELGNKAQVAHATGVPRSTIHDHLKRYMPGAVQPREVPAVHAARGLTEADIERMIRHHADTVVRGEPIAPPKRQVIATHAPDHLWDVPLKSGKVFALGCTHWPHTHAGAYHAALDRMLDFKPDLVVHGGDALDNHAISRHPSRKDKGLLKKDREDAEPWIEKLARAARETPAGTVDLIMGNHDDWFGRLSHLMPGIHGYFDYHEHMDLPRDWRVYANQTRLRIGGAGGLLLLHGDILGRVASGGQVPANAVRKVLKTHAVSWHFHRRSVAQPQEVGLGGVRERRVWTAGWMGDPRAPEYIVSPEWTIDIVEIHIDGPGDFEVQVHTWDTAHRRFFINGRRYS